MVVGAVGDHPRSRGVYFAKARPYCSDVGSSPLARGLREHERVACAQHGIIPARAGFTEYPIFDESYREDHPRSRGVYSSIRLKGNSLLGSSPLARGLRRRAQHGDVDHRIIPARAGFTCTTGRLSARRWDHPRSRGVYTSPPRTPPTVTGSSPLARGLRGRVRVRLRAERIIPARAGFTTSARARSLRSRGSSPLARGLQGILLSGQTSVGIIPARAGFTGP